MQGSASYLFMPFISHISFMKPIYQKQRMDINVVKDVNNKSKKKIWR